MEDWKEERGKGGVFFKDSHSLFSLFAFLG